MTAVMILALITRMQDVRSTCRSVTTPAMICAEWPPRKQSKPCARALNDIAVRPAPA